MTPKRYASSQHKIRLDQIDPDALTILETLRNAGFTAYLVGGSVRDLILGHTPKDFDISTSATPEEVKPLFRSCFLIGRRFRLAHVRFGKKVFEVSTFRCGDVESDDLIIRDNDWGTEEEDVLRRDFTINGLFYDSSTEEIIDYVGGYEDAKKAHLRCIGNPFARFKQDPIRMIRLLKFQARFGLTADLEMIESMSDLTYEVLKSSKPRLLEEFLRMLESGSSLSFIKLLAEHRFLEILTPALSHFLEIDQEEQIYRFLEVIDKEIETGKTFDRSIMIAALIFPLLEKHLQALSETRKKKLHLGIIHDQSLVITRDAFAPNLLLTKKILGSATQILATQFRFTPLIQGKKIHYRIPRTPDFPKAITFLKLRSLLDPHLAKVHEGWNYYFEKHKKKSPPPERNRRPRRRR